jgi:hypothetical protein
VPDLVLLEQKGRAHQLSRLPGRVVVVFVTGNGCPLGPRRRLAFDRSSRGEPEVAAQELPHVDVAGGDQLEEG